MRDNALPVGAVVSGRYRILKVLGQGGFGITYLVRDEYLATELALKECFPEQCVIRDVNGSQSVIPLPTKEELFHKLKEKFIEEARTIFGLHGDVHIEGIVHVYNVEEANNTGYMAMEYLDGETLKSYLNAQGPVDCIWLLTLVKPVLLALQCIHTQGLLHRDIAPDNLMLIQRNGKEKLVLIDFGAVKQVAKGSTTIAIAKPGYAPPEQFDPKEKLTWATDIYALCATIYAMLGGSVPADATTRLSGIVLSRKDPLIGLHELNAQIPQEVDNIIAKGMQLDATKRYQSANEMAEDVERFLKKKQSITVEYYYNAILGKTEYVQKQAHSTLNIEQLKTEEPGFILSKTENLPLQVSFDDNENIVRLYDISQRTACCTIEYYYDDVVETEMLTGLIVGSQVSYQDKPKPDFFFDHAENAPLTVGKNDDNNIIRVYYRSVAQVTCKIEYYYDHQLDEAATLTFKGKVGDRFSYQGYEKPRDMYRFDCAKNDPLILSSDPEENIIRVYYSKKTVLFESNLILHYCYDGVENTAERLVQPLENDLKQAVAKHAKKKEGYRLVYRNVNSTSPGVVDITYYYVSCKPTEPEPEPKPQPQPKPKPHKATKRWWIALAVLLVIAGCIAFFVPHLQKQDAEPQYAEPAEPGYAEPQYAVGDYVTFGTYPQTAEGNDETPIEWQVLDCDGNSVLLLSRYGLAVQPYNNSWDSYITWEKCTLRTWLNNDFMNRAFTATEQSAILLTNVDNSSGQCYSGWNTTGGYNTQDKVFLLSYAEANKYLGVTLRNSNAKACAAPTAYAIAQGAWQDSSYTTEDGEGNVRWWLRSPGYCQYGAARVYPDGSLRSRDVGFARGSVRPALWVNLENAGDLIRACEKADKQSNTAETSPTVTATANNTKVEAADEPSAKQSNTVEVTPTATATANNTKVDAAGEPSAKQTNTVEATPSVTATANNAKVDAVDEPSAKQTNTVEATPTVTAAAQNTKVAVGDYVTFGTYPQTAEGDDETPIEWLVLDRDGNKALLLSRYGLDAQPYHTERKSITWEQCSLRTWLNNDFMNRAFTAAEESAILLTSVDNSSSQGYSEWRTKSGNNTQDKVFLLSYAEANKYLDVTYYGGRDIRSRVAPTAYGIAQGAWQNSISYTTEDGEAAGWWWLRSPGYDQGFAARVYANGSLISFLVHDVTGSVRPAMWVNLENAGDLIRACENLDKQSITVEATPTVTAAAQNTKVAVGDYVTFGTYPQTAVGDDETPIEWLVLDRDGNKALLLSRYGLDAQPYHTKWESITWEKCSLRTWLNNDFMNRAFTAAEESAILLTSVDNSNSQGYSEWRTKSGNNTQDKVFLLSYAEANKYLDVTYNDSNNIRARVAPTAYAVAQGAWQNSKYTTEDGAIAGWWWLRSPGYYMNDAADISTYGVLRFSDVYYDSGSVRPALWVNLDLINGYERTDKQSKTDEANATVLARNTEVDVGDYVTFGTYPQTKVGNDKTPIEWLVLDRDGDNVLLLSRYGLDEQPYHTKNESITWEKCALRTWLNNEFMNRAFTAAEQSAILLTNVDNSNRQQYWGEADGGNNTQDKVFLLSNAEANKYLDVTSNDGDTIKSRVAPTAYAIAQGAWQDDSYKTEAGEGAVYWWLRSPSDQLGDDHQFYAAAVSHDGSLVYSGLSYCQIHQQSGSYFPNVQAQLTKNSSGCENSQQRQFRWSWNIL